MSEYFNEYGLMRMHKDKPVENGILFRFRYESYYAYWSSGNVPYESKVSANCAIMVSRGLMDETNSYRNLMSNPPEETQHFSRDNMYGMFGLCYMYRPDMLKYLPLMWWNNRKGTDKITPWLHPNGWMVFMSLKNKFWSWVWLMPIFAMFLFSYFSWMKNKNETSGLCLWFDILPLLAKQNAFFTLVYDFIEANLFGDVQECQDYYASMGGVWQNHDNPLRRLINDN